jgi:Tol biopolymer transport system component
MLRPWFLSSLLSFLLLGTTFHSVRASTSASTKRRTPPKSVEKLPTIFYLQAVSSTYSADVWLIQRMPDGRERMIVPAGKYDHRVLALYPDGRNILLCSLDDPILYRIEIASGKRYPLPLSSDIWCWQEQPTWDPRKTSKPTFAVEAQWGKGKMPDVGSDHFQLTLVTIDAFSGQVREVAAQPQDEKIRYPTWSPRGDLIAFSTGVNMEVVSPTGKDRRIIAKADHWADKPSWSPDGSKIVFLDIDTENKSALAQLKMCSLAGGGIRNLGPAVSTPIWLPDNKAIIVATPVAAGGSRMERMDVTTGKREVLVRSKFLLEPVYRLSGGSLLISATAQRSADEPDEELYVLRPSGKQLERIKPSHAGTITAVAVMAK